MSGDPDHFSDAPTQPAGVSTFAALQGLNSRSGKYLPVATFAAGFIWDSLTLTRVDRLSDNLILLAYLLALAVMIVFTLRRQAGLLTRPLVLRYEPHFPWAMQFLIGGLLSSYVVFYFKSVSWSETQVFFILLVALLVGNEFLQQRLANPLLLATLFFFCAFSFFAFFVPVVVAKVGTGMFLVSGLFSLTLALAVFSVAIPLRSGDWTRRMGRVAGCIVAVYILLNLFYAANLIPPVPLSLKRAGIYHDVRRTATGYEVRYLPPPRFRFWKQWEDPLLLSPGENACCYTAIFAPRRIHVPVQHVWRYYQPRVGWVTTDRIAFEVTGGRDGGYRGFSRKKSITSGKWRVEVATEQGAILGRIDFTVVANTGPHPPMIFRVID